MQRALIRTVGASMVLEVGRVAVMGHGHVMMGHGYPGAEEVGEAKCAHR